MDKETNIENLYLEDYHHLYVSFTQYNKKDTNILNNLIASIAGKYTHVEITFENRIKNITYSSSIWQNEPLYFKKKHFGRPHWIFLEILGIDQSKIKKMMQFCEIRHSQNMEFDLSAMLLAITPFPPTNINNKTFCVKHVMETFQSSGYLKEYMAGSYSPYDFYVMLNDPHIQHKEGFSTKQSICPHMNDRKKMIKL
jgi:hypothetical protein